MDQKEAQVPAKTQQQPLSPLAIKMAERYGMEPAKFATVLRETYFKTSEATPLSNSEIAAGLIVCSKYDLDPFTQEIHVTRYQGRLLVMVGIDGWLKIAQRNPSFDGMEFEEHFDQEGAIESIKATIHRKDQDHPTIVTAYMEEYRRKTPAWETMPIRMLRHKAAKEALRYAFGISGIDDEEPEEIQAGPFIRKSRSLNLDKPEDTPQIESMPFRDP